MIGMGTAINVLAILFGGAAGLLLGKRLPRRLTETVMQGVGLAVLIVGVGGALEAAFSVADGRVSAENTLMMILSLAGGGLLGAWIGIEEKLDSLAKRCEHRFAKPGEAASFAQGFTATALIFCVGSMAVLGALEDGLEGKRDVLLAKSALDGVTAAVFASTLGWGVLFAAVPVGLYQGSITLLAALTGPFLQEEAVRSMSLVGSVMIAGIGLNILQIAKIRVGDLLPAIFIPLAYHAALSCG